MSSVFEISVELPQGGFFKDFLRFLEKELRAAETEIKKLLNFKAKDMHRYQHRTRRLRASTATVGKLTSKKGLVLGINKGKGKTKYGRYIIQGFKTWAPDPFIDAALDSSVDRIIEIVERAVDRAISNFNRS